MKSCHIVGAGECNELIIKKESGDLIIAADGGYAYLEKAGIKLKKETVEMFIESAVRAMKEFAEISAEIVRADDKS